VDLHAQLSSDFLIRLPLRSLQNNLGALRLPYGDFSPPGPLLKGCPLTPSEVNLGFSPHCAPPTVDPEGNVDDIMAPFIYVSFR
jgi:hypothetical protein